MSVSPRVLAGVQIDETAPKQLCKACGAVIWFGLTKAGRPCPFDVVDGARTAITHFSTCPSWDWQRRPRGRP